MAGNWSLAVSGVLAFLLLINAGQRIRAWYHLRHFKGPLTASFSRFWLIRHSLAGRLQWDFAEVTDKYGMCNVKVMQRCQRLTGIGSLARIGPKHLLTSDPEVMRRILAVRSPYRRSEWYLGARFNPKYDNCGSQRDEEKHSKLRAKMAAGVRSTLRDILPQLINLVFR